jgi:hypothetical protein
MLASRPASVYGVCRIVTPPFFEGDAHAVASHAAKIRFDLAFEGFLPGRFIRSCSFLARRRIVEAVSAARTIVRRAGCEKLSEKPVSRVIGICKAKKARAEFRRVR